MTDFLAPYGVRAGAKTLGHRDSAKQERIHTLIEGIPALLREDFVPPTKPYELSQVLDDLIAFASSFLVPGGRLVFWLPTSSEEYKDVDIPRHPRFRIIANSLQDFGKWGRRLITMEKLLEDEESIPISEPIDRRTLGHFAFRQKYMKGFKT